MNYKHNALNLIGGHIEEGEDCRTALVREIEEELPGVSIGMDIVVGAEAIGKIEIDGFNKKAHCATKYSISVFLAYVIKKGWLENVLCNKEILNRLVTYQDIYRGITDDGVKISDFPLPQLLSLVRYTERAFAQIREDSIHCLIPTEYFSLVAYDKEKV